MGRREKQKAKKIDHEEDDANASTSMVAGSSDDEEANEDLSLKIVEKALLKRAPKLVSNELVAEPYDDVLNGTRGIERKKKRKKVKKEKMESGDGSAVVAEEQVTVETINGTEKNEPAEAGTVQLSDNIVLRKLLRGPRYFDPPDSGWGTCYNCGEEGHSTVNCTVAKRKKPCFICGSLGHSVKQCTKARDCFICKKGGHRAKECPEKHKSGSKSSTICLKCGNSGHEMFSCKNDYSLDDLKEIQCYVCKRFGHLCCVNPTDAPPTEISCYQCGQLGHTGLACSRLRTDAIDSATPSSCYKCGEEGHFARECSSSLKAGKRQRELSNTKLPRFQKEYDYVGYRSAPHDMGKVKRKRPLTVTEERGITTPQKSKHGRSWMTELPGDFSPSKSKRTSWMSPVTPSTKSIKIHAFSNGSHTPSSKSKSSKMWKVHDGTPNSPGSAKALFHRFSASRFGNSGSDGLGRSYNW